MKRLVLVDTSAVARTLVAYGTIFSIPTIDGGTYETTNIFSLMQIFKKIHNLDLSSDNIVFCCDRWSIRKAFVKEDIEGLLSEGKSVDEVLSSYEDTLTVKAGDTVNDYKSGRKKTSESYLIQLHDIEEGLVNAGFNVVAKDDYEADDIIAYLANKYKNEYDKVEIFTNDFDISNCLDKEGKIALRKISKFSHDADVSTFEQEFKIPFNTSLLYKCTVGDKSDKIKGIFRFGDKSFLGLLNYIKDKDIAYEDIRENNLEEGLLRQYFAGDEDKLMQGLYALALVKPRVEGLDINIHPIEYTKDTLIQLLDKYKINSVKKFITNL